MGTPPKNAKLRFLLLSACTNSFFFVRVKSHYKNEGIFRFGPPISMDTMFSRFLVHFSFSVKDKKKSAEGAEDAEAPQPLGGRWGVDVYGPRIKLAKFRNFGNLLRYIFFKILFLLKSAFQCKVPFRSHWWDNFFFDKKNGCWIRNFSHFSSRKMTFWCNFWTPLFLDHNKNFWGPLKKTVQWGGVPPPMV